MIPDSDSEVVHAIVNFVSRLTCVLSDPHVFEVLWAGGGKQCGGADDDALLQQFRRRPSSAIQKGDLGQHREKLYYMRH